MAQIDADRKWRAFACIFFFFLFFFSLKNVYTFFLEFLARIVRLSPLLGPRLVFTFQKREQSQVVAKCRRMIFLTCAVCSHCKKFHNRNDRERSGREMQNCRYFWKCAGNSNFQKINNHEDQNGLVAKSRNIVERRKKRTKEQRRIRRRENREENREEREKKREERKEDRIERREENREEKIDERREERREKRRKRRNKKEDRIEERREK